MEERLIWIGYLLAADYCAYRPVAEAYCQKLRPFLSEARFWSSWQNGIVYSFCKDSAVNSCRPSFSLEALSMSIISWASFSPISPWLNPLSPPFHASLSTLRGWHWLAWLDHSPA